jgi:hypothetical protein
LQRLFDALNHWCMDLAIVTATTTVTATREKGIREMGVDLFDHGGASFNWHGWRHCLEIAEKFGWVPAGTEAPSWNEGGEILPADRDLEWSGSYCSNDYQSVTDADAKAIARALFRALGAVGTDQTLRAEQLAALEEANLDVIAKLAHYAWRVGSTLADPRSGGQSAARAHMGTIVDGSIDAFFGPRRDGDLDCLWEPPVIFDRKAEAAYKLW